MDYIEIGKIINSHGIRGEVKIYPLTDDINRFSLLKTVYIGEKKLEVEVERVKYHKNLAILKFKEFNDINEILKFKESFLYVDEEERITLPENHFFIYDLVGCQVLDTKLNPIGTLTDVIQGHKNDVYVIKSLGGDKEYLIPAVKAFIIDVNLDAKQIIIEPIEGMIE